MPRLTGKNGALYVSITDGASWLWVADLYEWMLDVRTITFPGSIKGDRFDRRVPSHSEGRLTARRYVTATSVLAVLAVAANNVIGAGNVFTTGQRLAWAVVAVDPNFPQGGSPSTFDNNPAVKAQGTGYVERGHLGAPRTQIEDDLEVILDTLTVLN